MSLPENIEALMKIFPDLDRETATFYLEVNAGNLDEAVLQILDEKAQEHKKPPGGQPSSRQPSSGQPSSGQPSSGQPSGSRDFENPMFQAEKKIEKEARELDFDIWLNAMIHEYARPKTIELKHKLEKLFGKKGWSVIDPRGDGFCGLYAATIDYSSESSESDIVMSKEEIINSIVKGVEEYYKARELHIRNGFPLPNELTKPKVYLTFTPQSFNEATGEVIEANSMYITQDNVKTDVNKEALKQRLQILKTLSNMPGEVFMFLAYAYKRNFLVLHYDDRSSDPCLLLWTPCYADAFRVDDAGPVTYPYAEATSIMFNNLHYFLFHNPNPERKQEAIARIRGGEWTRPTQARGIRKSRKARKARKAIFTTKLKKQKYSIKKMRRPKKRTKKY